MTYYSNMNRKIRIKNTAGNIILSDAAFVNLELSFGRGENGQETSEVGLSQPDIYLSTESGLISKISASMKRRFFESSYSLFWAKF